MRLTRDLLLKAARELTLERVRAQRGILAVYLCGSVLEEDPLLGDTGDIDLVFIYIDQPAVEREIIRLNDLIHLDILNHSQSVYGQPRQLRVHPWMGHTIYTSKVLHDPQHFMDFTVAGVRAQFDLPEYVYQRVHTQIEVARQIWLAFVKEDIPPGAFMVNKYLEALENAANAIVSLSDAPLSMRRFLANFPIYAEEVGSPGLAIGLHGLLGGLTLDAKVLQSWISAWDAAYKAVNLFPNPPLDLHPDRRLYYRAGIQALIESSRPVYALWPLLRTWAQIASNLPSDNYHQGPWQSVCRYLSLDKDSFEQRLSALDAYLDTVEEIVDRWAQAHGVSV